MATNSKVKRVNKSAAVKVAIEAISICGIVDGENVLTAAPTIDGGLPALLARAGSAAATRSQSMHDLAACIMFGAVAAPDVIAIEWPRSLKSDKSVALKICNYVQSNGVVSLVAAWQGKQSKATRKSTISLNGLLSAIKSPSASTADSDGESLEPTTDSVVGRVSSDAKQSADLAATIGSIVEILADSISADKKLAKIAKLNAVHAAAVAYVAAQQNEAA